MKYLKLFQSNESANNFAINDIPFIGYVNDPSWGGGQLQHVKRKEKVVCRRWVDFGSGCIGSDQLHS